MNIRIMEDVKKKLEAAENVVFFGGAGTSTESHIPDFRSASQGLYQKDAKGYPPEELLSHRMLRYKPEVFFEYYLNNLVYPEAKPNKAHKVLAEWEKQGKLKAIITQNIDGLHQMAGSKKVLEVHGSVLKNYCIDCREKETLEEMMNQKDRVPRCKKCNGIVRPDVVLYGESLDSEVLETAVWHISQADFLIVGGSSLVVHPAAGLINYYRGKDLLIINRDNTPYDHRARWTIRESIGQIMETLNSF
ncbi:NAD-dependent protein deacylase [Tindallia californiensis]|uniref:NAD-dependent protein deacetylase n=1 Tax=Tindallia californiensis TaxID=159292 RepID=A0A1H3MUY8_9FIRM|nr:NAD-dependent protein deacylase [Tindallia californiensis]SDY80491.1 NAD-dependent deacetylase [Tindallia californiensis]